MSTWASTLRMAFRFEYRSYHAAFRAPLITAHGIWAERDGIVIRIADEAERTAFGEIAPLPAWGTETFDEATAFCAAQPAEFARDAPTVPDVLPCCQFAFESAFEALRHPNAPAPVRTFAVTALLPAGTAALKALDEATFRGHRSFKWKVGVYPSGEEIGLLPRLLDRLPSGGQLRLDANGAWDLPTTESWLQACEGRPIEFIEQPLPVGREEPIIRLAHEFTTRLALDESVVRPADLLRWLEFGWPGIYVIKPALAGSPSRLLRWLDAYEAEAVFSSAFETAFGARAALQFAARASHDHRALGFGTFGCFADKALNLTDPGPTLSTKWLARLELGPLWDRLPNLLRAA